MPDAPPSRPTDRHLTALALTVVGAVYLITLALLPRDGLWTVDNGNKLLLVQALLRSGYRSAALPWPGQAVDPALAFNPMPPPFTVVQGGQLYSIFSPFFSLLAAPLFSALGYAGLYVLPLLGTLTGLKGLGRLAAGAGLTGRGSAAVVLAAGLATPLWFYAVVFWEHALAAACCVWALACAFDYGKTNRTADLARAAVLAALAIYFRDELYLFLPALLVLLLGAAPGGRLQTASLFTGAAAAALIPLWLLNLRYTGHVTGFHLETHILSSGGLIRHLEDRGAVFYHILARLHPEAWVSALLAAPYLLLLALRPRLPAARLPAAAGAACLAGLAGFAVTATTYFDLRGPLWAVFHSNSLFGAAPFLIAGLLTPAEGEGVRVRRALQGLVLGYAALYVLAAPLLGSFGYHWGCRFLLPLYPLLALLAVATLTDATRASGPSWVNAAAVLAAVASLGAQQFSIHLLWRAADFHHRLNAAVAEAPERVVITSGLNVGQELYGVFYEKPVFLVRSRGEWNALVPRLNAAGHDRALLVEPLGFRPRPAPKEAYRDVRDNGLRFYSARLRSRELTEAGTAGRNRVPRAVPEPARASRADSGFRGH